MPLWNTMRQRPTSHCERLRHLVTMAGGVEGHPWKCHTINVVTSKTVAKRTTNLCVNCTLTGEYLRYKLIEHRTYVVPSE